MQTIKLQLYPMENPIVQDSYDSLIAALISSPRNPKTICVTGSSPGIGKTTISINLAISLAMTGRRVLLVDTDIRKTTQQKRLNSDGLLGLSDYLFSAMRLEDIIAVTNIPLLHMLVCGESGSINPLGMLYSPRFADLLELVKRAYDYTIFDTSALSANTDPTVIASLTDGTFMLVCPDESVDVYRKNVRKLTAMGASIIGVVFNKAPQSEYKNHMEFYSKRISAKARKKQARRGR